ncbi:hypothetical protein LCGC14_1934120 [marine sediment metagenome]|uniref:Nicotinamide riboside transporter PnuC n=1 Tax=marine sediment metagenome TaxID=412755 RepID=A0A0F9GAK5_9ZZZZ
MINLIGWIGNLFFVLGALFLAKKWIAGWWMQILGNLCYVAFAILMGLNGGSLLALSVLLTIINYYGLKKWRNSEWVEIQ